MKEPELPGLPSAESLLRAAVESWPESVRRDVYFDDDGNIQFDAHGALQRVVKRFSKPPPGRPHLKLAPKGKP